MSYANRRSRCQEIKPNKQRCRALAMRLSKMCKYHNEKTYGVCVARGCVDIPEADDGKRCRFHAALLRIYAERHYYRQQGRGLESKHGPKTGSARVPRNIANRIIDMQGGLCAACGGSQQPAHGTRLFIDHCHETGLVRGALCHRCNVALGFAGDSVSTLRSLTRYLERRGSVDGSPPWESRATSQAWRVVKPLRVLVDV